MTKHPNESVVDMMAIQCGYEIVVVPKEMRERSSGQARDGFLKRLFSWNGERA